MKLKVIRRAPVTFAYVRLRLGLPYLHAPDETVLDQVYVLDKLVYHNVSGQVADDLANVDRYPPVLVGLEAQRFNVRVDQLPLARPVVADTAVTVNVPALHSVRPANVDTCRAASAPSMSRALNAS